MNLDLSGKNALVCGSTQGIGKATALELAKLGATITLLARNKENLIATLAELDKSKNQQHNYLCADFADPAALKQQLQAIESGATTIHILVNNTGGPAGGPAEKAKGAQAHRRCP